MRGSVRSLAERVSALPRPLLLAFDVDGTLAPIVDDPTAARVPRSVVRQLRKLHNLRGVHVALVTGRDHRSLNAVLNADRFHRALEHGRVLARPGQRPPARALTSTQRAKLGALRGWAEAQTGIELEDKSTSLAVHVRRLAKRSPHRARHILTQAGRKARALGLHARAGRAVMEAELFDSDKGDAVRRLRRATRARSVLFVGDDVTDHAGIEAAVAAGGLGLFVRSDEHPRAPRGANGSLRGPGEVHALIEALAESL